MQRTDHAHNDLLHAGIRQFEDLDRALLCDLLRTLDELLALHRVFGAHAREVFGRKGRDAAELEFLAWRADGVADRENAGVKDTDDVSRVRLVDDFALGGHQLLRLGKAHFFVSLHVIIFRVALELARADAHKGKPVSVRLVHVCLNLENERRKIGAERIDQAAVGHARQRARGHAQKLFEERLHAEVRECRAKEHRRQLSALHFLHVELTSRAKKLHVVF